MSHNFEPWMIVFLQDKFRVRTFNRKNKLLTLNIFPALDSIHQFDKCEKLALENNLCTKEYIDVCKQKPGKLGCNLSHQLLLKQILEESPKDWNLVLEDDVDISPSFLKEVNRKIGMAHLNGSRYIQLYTHPKFCEKQREQHEVASNMYNMIFQWGTCGYLIHKDAIRLFLGKFPLSENIDIAYGKMISSWKSLCWLDNGIITLGSLDNYDNKSELGSLIYNKDANV